MKKEKRLGYVDLEKNDLKHCVSVSIYNRNRIIYRDSMNKMDAKRWAKKDGAKVYEVILRELK